MIQSSKHSQSTIWALSNFLWSFSYFLPIHISLLTFWSSLNHLQSLFFQTEACRRRIYIYLTADAILSSSAFVVMMSSPSTRLDLKQRRETPPQTPLTLFSPPTLLYWTMICTSYVSYTSMISTPPWPSRTASASVMKSGRRFDPGCGHLKRVRLSTHSLHYPRTCIQDDFPKDQ